MLPQRLSVKFFVKGGSTVDLAPFTSLFHRFIQAHTLEGLLIDVADYKHVPEGPGILIIGHEVDYALDLTGGKPGLMVRRKRYEGQTSLADVLRDTLRKALLAAQAIEKDGSAKVRFDVNTVEVTLIDRLTSPNNDDSFKRAKPLIEGVLGEFYEGGLDLSRGNTDPRQNLSVVATAKKPAELAALVDRLEAKVS